MESKDKRIKLIRDQVEKAKRMDSGRPSFSKQLKQEVAMLLQSGVVSAVELAQITGLSMSSLNRWSSKSAPFHKVTEENSSKIVAANDFSFKLTLPNGISLESSSEVLLKKVFELASL